MLVATATAAPPAETLSPLVWADPQLAPFFRGARALVESLRLAPSHDAVRARLIWQAAGQDEPPRPWRLPK